MRPTKKQCRSLNELLIEKMLVMKAEGRSSYRNYRTIIHYIQTHYGIVQMKDVNTQFAANLHAKMRSEGKSAATIKTYFALLQSIVNYGQYLGLFSGDPKLTRSKSRSYELDKICLEKPRTRRNKWLLYEDICKLWDYWLTLNDGTKGEKRWLGLFFASYLCNGANLADILRLKYDDEYYSSGKIVFGFYRQKTINSSGAYVRVPIINNLKMIIETIGDDEMKNGLVFGSFLNDVDVNDKDELDLRVMYANTYCSKVVKKVCGKLGIRSDVSVTFARHSYITRMNHIGAPYALIERNAGHTLAGVADSYVGDYDIQTLFKWNEMLL